MIRRQEDGDNELAMDFVWRVTVSEIVSGSLSLGFEEGL